MKPEIDNTAIFLLWALFVGLAIRSYAENLSLTAVLLWVVCLMAAASLVVVIYQKNFSKQARERKKAQAFIEEIPKSLLIPSQDSVRMGVESDLQIPIYLPDSIRSRHVHIMGATGSGKTESVILNFLKQDVARGLGAIILDAKGDSSFLEELKTCVPKEKLKVFDLGTADCMPYNPLLVGSPLEASQRLFSSLVWSEEYYASKARAALSMLFERHQMRVGRNPTLLELKECLESPESFAGNSWEFYESED